MKVQRIDSNNFKGYDVRPLKGFLMNSNPYGIANEMKAIADREGFKLYSVVERGVSNKCVRPTEKSLLDAWAQDIWTILKDNILNKKNDKKTEYIKDFFGLKNNFVQHKLRDSISENKHISGGNLFIVNGVKGDEVLVGQGSLKDFSVSTIKEMYNVEKVTILPQMDFHLDLFIRPLDKQRILLADDKLVLKALKKGYDKFLYFMSTLSNSEREQYLLQGVAFQNLIRECEVSQNSNCNAKSDEVESILKRRGFEVIKVPGRIYDTSGYCGAGFLYHTCNYMNANVIKNPEGKLVYITNKSFIDDRLRLTPELSKKIGFSFENEFVKSISEYVDREHIYFINGEKDFVKNQMLYSYGGGIHCLCTEIPE